MTNTPTDKEREVVFLKAINELIDSMVNYQVLELRGNDPHSEIVFRNDVHQKFFSIVLTDFLSRTDRKAVKEQTSFLGALKSICENPYFNVDNSVAPLNEATIQFTEWLNQEVTVTEVWLPSIDLETSLKLSRIQFLKMCGNISKHNFLRLSGPAIELRDLLAASNVTIEVEDALVVLADFYERFYTDILNYLGSTLAEFLNNIRWGIHEYLRPEFDRTIVWKGGDPPRYEYTFPKEVKTKLGRDCYWELMNDVRRAPIVRRFEVTKHLKKRY